MKRPVFYNILYLLLIINLDTRHLNLTYCQFIMYSYIITELLIPVPQHALMLSFI